MGGKKRNEEILQFFFIIIIQFDDADDDSWMIIHQVDQPRTRKKTLIKYIRKKNITAFSSPKIYRKPNKCQIFLLI